MAEPWPSYSSSSRGKKKRPRPPNDDATSSQGRSEDGTSLEDNLIFSDTLIALQLMRTQFPKLEKDSIPVPQGALESQSACQVPFLHLVSTAAPLLGVDQLKCLQLPKHAETVNTAPG